MDRKKRSTVFGAALIILCLLVLAVGRLRPDWEGPLLRLPQGGLSRPSQGQQTVPAGPAAAQLTFTPADGARVSLRYGDNCNYRPDVQALLRQPLQWQLREADPTVLIIHTHGSESYTRQPGQDYAPSGDYRTLDTDHNMIALGDYLTSLLEAAGIRVIHDKTLQITENESTIKRNEARIMALSEEIGKNKGQQETLQERISVFQTIY